MSIGKSVTCGLSWMWSKGIFRCGKKKPEHYVLVYLRRFCVMRVWNKKKTPSARSNDPQWLQNGIPPWHNIMKIYYKATANAHTHKCAFSWQRCVNICTKRYQNIKASRMYVHFEIPRLSVWVIYSFIMRFPTFFFFFIYLYFVFFFRPDLPHIILPNTKYMSINGGVASMACEATGDQPIHISWIKGSVQLNYKSSNLR